MEVEAVLSTRGLQTGPGGLTFWNAYGSSEISLVQLLQCQLLKRRPLEFMEKEEMGLFQGDQAVIRNIQPPTVGLTNGQTNKETLHCYFYTCILQSIHLRVATASESRQNETATNDHDVVYPITIYLFSRVRYTCVRGFKQYIYMHVCDTWCVCVCSART